MFFAIGAFGHSVDVRLNAADDTHYTRCCQELAFIEIDPESVS